MLKPVQVRPLLPPRHRAASLFESSLSLPLLFYPPHSIQHARVRRRSQELQNYKPWSLQVNLRLSVSLFSTFGHKRHLKLPVGRINMPPKSHFENDPGKLMPATTTTTTLTSTIENASRKYFSIQKRILRNQRVPFLFIANGDFSIVWSNVVAFSLGHLVYLYSMYILFFERNDKTNETWLFGE